MPRAADDAELAASAAAGDRTAFAEIYDRYGSRIYGFCYTVVRNADDAAEVTQDTFVRAAENMGQLRDPSKLKSWLFAIARHESLRRIGQRNRTTPDEDAELMADLRNPDPGTAGQDVLESAELSTLVWEAAEGLDERDRVVLDLTLRQGMNGEELAEALGVDRAHGYVIADRMRDRIERSLGALLVARQGRDDCPELRALLGDWDGKFSARLRRRVARHVDTCEMCSAKRAALVSPAALLAVAPIVAAPLALRASVLGAVQASGGIGAAGLAVGGAGALGWASGFPPAMALPAGIAPAAAAPVAAVGASAASGAGGSSSSSATTVAGAGAAVVLAAAVAVGAVVATRGDDGDGATGRAAVTEVPDGIAAGGSAPGDAITVTSAPVTTAPPTTSAAPVTTTSATTAPVTTASAGPDAVTTTAPAGPDTSPPPTTEPPPTTTGPVTVPPTAVPPTTVPFTRISIRPVADVGTGTSGSLSITNDGTEAAAFTVSPPAGVAVSPPAGSVAPGATSTIAVTVDRTVHSGQFELFVPVSVNSMAFEAVVLGS